MGLEVLVQLYLIKIIIEEDMSVLRKKLWMHHQLRDLGRKVITDENFQDVMSAADCGCPRMLQKCSSKMRTKKKSRSCVFAQAIAATADRFWLPYPCTRIPSPVVFATMFQKMDMNLRTDTPSRRKNFQVFEN
ncbi:hypothetical protein CRG98_015990 [Punica granatum]|uniref:Uncharacterized protein n=1 Tax=Punica granatum TaxID=22663 RepID=A0A2I0K4Y1_PUNGR|nr:hypothetical protein CRG98_015990 [Punica granatum]